MPEKPERSATNDCRRVVIPLATAAGRRLVGPARMFGAIRQALGGSLPAKMEIGMARIADGPFADPIGEREDGGAWSVLDLDRLRHRFDPPRRLRRRRDDARSRSLDARAPDWPLADDSGRPILDRRRSPHQSEPVRLTDDRIARNPPEAHGDLAGAETLLP